MKLYKAKISTGQQPTFIDVGKEKKKIRLSEHVYDLPQEADYTFPAINGWVGGEWWERKLKEADEDCGDMTPKMVHTISTQHNSRTVSAEREQDSQRQIQFITTVNHFC